MHTHTHIHTHTDTHTKQDTTTPFSAIPDASAGAEGERSQLFHHLKAPKST